MPKIAFPRSDSQRLIHLSQLAGRLGQPTAAKQLPQNLRQEVFAEKASFELAVRDFAQAQRVCSEALRLRNHLLHRLKKTVRHFVARVRITASFAETNHDAVFLSYNLHPKRNPAAYKDPVAWCAWATDLIAGEQRELEQGREAISYPSQGELLALRDQTKAALLAFARANRAKQAAAIVLGKRRPLLMVLLRRLAAYLHYRFQGEPKAVRIACFRSMGYRFVTQSLTSNPVPSQEVVASSPKLKAEVAKPSKRALPQGQNSQNHRLRDRRMLLDKNVPCKIKAHTVEAQPYQNPFATRPPRIREATVKQHLSHGSQLRQQAG